MRIRDLGPLVVDVDGQSVELGSTKQAALLARLVISPGRMVSADALITAGWGPDTATSQPVLDSQLYRLRNVLEPHRSGASELIVKSGSGYLLRLGAEHVDSARFVQLTAETDASIAVGAEAATTLSQIDEALGLWRGRAYEPITDLPDVAAAATRLDELRSQLLERKIEILIAAGRADRALAELEPLIAAAPYREHLWALRIRSLARLGRVEEALAAHQRARDLLREELGLDPGAELRDLQSQILSGEVAGPEPATPSGAGADSAVPDPKSIKNSPPLVVRLPRRATRLVGRNRDLDRVVALIRQNALVTLVGPGGCGKTRLSVELANAVAGGFADGVWFVDLTAAMDPGDVAELVVSAMGLGASPIEDPLDRLTDFVADKALLLIMDNCGHGRRCRRWTSGRPSWRWWSGSARPSTGSRWRSSSPQPGSGPSDWTRSPIR